jgi:flagellar biogenesis protein FliO
MTALILALALTAAPTTADDVVKEAFGDARTSGGPVAIRPEQGSSALSKMFGWGLAIIAVSALAAMALKRRSQKAEAGFVELAQNVSVGPKRSLLVVSFAGKRMLVGSTEAGFTVLSSEDIPASPAVPSEFDELIRQAAALDAEAAELQS